MVKDFAYTQGFKVRVLELEKELAEVKSKLEAHKWYELEADEQRARCEKLKAENERWRKWKPPCYGTGPYAPCQRTTGTDKRCLECPHHKRNQEAKR